MYRLLVLLALITTLASAQISFPICATYCFNQGAAGAYGCGPNDFECACNPPASTEYYDCVYQSDCTQSQVDQFWSWAQQQCGAVGLTFTVPASSDASASATYAPTPTPTPVDDSGHGSAIYAPTPTPSFDDSGYGSATYSSDYASSTYDPDYTSATNYYNSSSSYTSSSNELSTGAKAGIGVGAALGALLITGIAALLRYRHRRKKQASPPAYTTHSAGDAVGAAEAGGGGGGAMGEKLPDTGTDGGAVPSSPSVASGDASGGHGVSSVAWKQEAQVETVEQHEVEGDQPTPEQRQSMLQQQHDNPPGHEGSQSTVL